MNDKKRVALATRYLRDFKCIGSACEDNCCIGWRVDIDHETYKKYQKIKTGELSKILKDNIARNRSSTRGEDKYARIMLKTDKSCPFLNDRMLCKIQLDCGENRLSDVCSTFPRVTNLVNGAFEQSATVSCPEIARLALLNQNGIEFDNNEDSIGNRNMIRETLNTSDLKLAGKTQKYFLEIRMFIISVLQNRDYKLQDRLIILGMFFQGLQKNISENKINETPDLINTYSNIVRNNSIKNELDSIPIQYTIQMELLKEISDKRYFMGGNGERFLECFKEFILGINYDSKTKVEEIADRYKKAYHEHYEPFMGSREYILENYLVNYIFKSFFPFVGEKALFDSYMVLVLHYSLIKMFLIGMSSFHHGLTEELVLKLIQSFAKAVEHNEVFIKEINELMRGNGYNTLPYMAILIKN